EIPDLDVPAAQPFGRLEQQLAPLIRGHAARIARLDEPVDQEFDLDILHAVVIENLAHLRVRVAGQHTLQIRMPEAYALEARACRGFDPLAEFEGAVLEF